MNSQRTVNERSLKFEWDDPLAVVAESLKLSGLDRLQAIVNGDLPDATLPDLLGMKITEFGKGYAEIQCTPGEYHCNYNGVVQGGVFAAIIDNSMGYATGTVLPQGKVFATTDFSLKIVRPLTLTSEPVVARGEVIHLGRRIVTSEAKLRGKESGKLYAHGASTCMVVDQPPKA